MRMILHSSLKPYAAPLAAGPRRNPTVSTCRGLGQLPAQVFGWKMTVLYMDTALSLYVCVYVHHSGALWRAPAMV